MESLAMPLASAAFFTVGCALLQTFRAYADHVTPVLAWIAALLLATILIVSGVQYQIGHGGAEAMLLPDPWMSTIP
ncbi:hypothetical protein [Methylobacterium sp. JK268]